MSLQFKKCACQGGTYHRIPRSLWMRFFSSKRLYQCSECDARIFEKPAEMTQPGWPATTGKFFVGQTSAQQPEK